MARPKAVGGKVEQLGVVLSELLALYSDPVNAADFARHESALSTALTKQQLLCSAIRCSFDRRKEASRDI
jgi:hypothetical protein